MHDAPAHVITYVWPRAVVHCATGPPAFPPTVLQVSAAGELVVVSTTLIAVVGAGHGESTRAAPPASAKMVTFAVPPVRPATSPAQPGSPSYAPLTRKAPRARSVEKAADAFAGHEGKTRTKPS